MSTASSPLLGSRSPRELALALLGEYVLDDPDTWVRAGLFIEVLEGAGIQPPATRAALDRLEQNGILRRERHGREVSFVLTTEGAAMLTEAGERVRNPQPLHADGDGWTLATFSVPEGQRTLRHRLRSTLTWEGFAPLRDGLWIAPGVVDLQRGLASLLPELGTGLVAFHARELDGFPIADAVRTAWDIDAIHAAHVGFIDAWSDSAVADASTALSMRVMLVADWLALVRIDPGLPRNLLEPEWPADRSLRLYLRLRDETAAPAAREFARQAPAAGGLAEPAIR